MTDAADLLIDVRRQWNDWRHASYRLSQIGGLHWDNMSGGLGASAPQLFMHGYVMCDAMESGELAHSCTHGPPPHRIKVCITKKGNEAVFSELLARCPKPLKSPP